MPPLAIIVNPLPTQGMRAFWVIWGDFVPFLDAQGGIKPHRSLQDAKDTDLAPGRFFCSAHLSSPARTGTGSHDYAGLRMADMSEPTVESLARRLNEKQVSRVKDWRTAAGMFTGRGFSKTVDDEGQKIREADREEGRQEFGE